MDSALHIEGRQFQYIARISHGKDSLKMLDVIVSRGLPLDRITTTDVWATDTIRGEHPKMVAFKEQADEFIWRKYRIEVEHLCAMRNGEKVTYEKLFYRVPKRKNAGGGAGNKEKYWASRRYGGHGASQSLNGVQSTRSQSKAISQRTKEFPYINRGLSQTASRVFRSALQIKGLGARSSKPDF